MDNNLPELRDIHLPQDVSPFPIADGWWLLALGIILLILIIQFALKLRRYSKSRYAIRLLDKINIDSPVAAARQMSEILRRICVYKYPKATAMLGEEWLDFINQHSKDKLSSRLAPLLLNAPYLPEKAEDFSAQDAQELRNFCRLWIGENL